jgi:C-terminal of NADH-ubiquinone oxidoreductase 21 kDa subunit
VVLHIVRLYGWTENNREVEMDMREMVDKVKKGEPLYGHSGLTPYMQGVAARNSRYSALMAQVLPWANFVNHNQVSGTTFAPCRECLTGVYSTASIRRNTTNKRSESWKRREYRKGRLHKKSNADVHPTAISSCPHRVEEFADSLKKSS